MQFDGRFLGLMLVTSLLAGALAGAGLATATTTSIEPTVCASTTREGVMTERLRPESLIVANVVR
jgi:hypothetical protein